MSWGNILKRQRGFDINKEGNAEIFIEEVEEFIKNGIYMDEDIKDSKEIIKFHLRKMRELDIAQVNRHLEDFSPMIKKRAQAITVELRGWKEAPFEIHHGFIYRRGMR